MAASLLLLLVVQLRPPALLMLLLGALLLLLLVLLLGGCIDTPVARLASTGLAGGPGRSTASGIVAAGGAGECSL